MVSSLISVTDVVPLDDSHVALRFSDGYSGILDMSKYFDSGVFRKLRDPKVFRAARVGVNTVTWDDGRIDIAPETAYEEVRPYIADYTSDDVLPGETVCNTREEVREYMLAIINKAR